MVNRLIFSLTLIFPLFLNVTLQTKPTSKNTVNHLLLLDTIGREEFVYTPFIKQANDAGFNITYMPFDQFADISNPSETFKDYQGTLFIFGLDFLMGIQGKSPLSKKILTFFATQANKPKNLLGLVLPPFNIKPGTGGMVNKLTDLFQPIVNNQSHASIGLTYHAQHKTTIEHFLSVTDEFLIKPLISRPCGYHTTLQPPHAGVPFLHHKLEQLLKHEGEKLVMLPKIAPGSTSKYASVLEKIVPFGLYWFNPIHKNHVFVTSTNALSFSSIKEDFHLCPVNTHLREEMEQCRATMICQLKNLFESKSIKNHKPRIKPSIKQHKKETKPSSKEKTAWMELVVFQDPLEDKKESDEEKNQRSKQQDQLVNYILSAKLDTLWISITPNILYSPIAREKHREKQILGSISLFTKKLQEKSTELKSVVPKLCVGFEITNNIYAPHLPATPAVDLYGTTYPDLPSPLSKEFWNNEIVKSFKKFVEQWKKPEISHNIKLSGIVIDLEMYCRRKSGTFLETMGFDRPTFARYLKQHTMTIETPQNAHAMISLLSEKQQCQQYFSFLEQEAEQIGQNIQKEIGKILPKGTISCYMPSILVDWFYKGFMKGLGSNNKPLHLFTFNTAFQPHESWFIQHNIPAYHSSVLLLSKLRQPKDFNWIKNILNNHSGIWLNRFSRLVEPQDPKTWMGVEQTAMNETDKEAFLKFIKEQ